MATFADLSRTRANEDAAVEATDFLGFATLFRGIRLLARAMAERRVVRREHERLARELSTYTDRELGELGFSRADLPMIAAGVYRR